MAFVVNKHMSQLSAPLLAGSILNRNLLGTLFAKCFSVYHAHFRHCHSPPTRNFITRAGLHDRIHARNRRHILHGLVFDATNLRTEWEKACAVTGLGKRVKVEGPENTWHEYKGLRLHDLRRSAVRNLRVLGNVAETVAMRISGHKTRAVFDRYNIVTTGDLHAAMQGVETATLALPAPKKQPRRASVQVSVQPVTLKGRKRGKPA